jgi:hypothetical protein
MEAFSRNRATRHDWWHEHDAASLPFIFGVIVFALWLVGLPLGVAMGLALGTVAILLALRRLVFPPERDDPVVIARLMRNAGRRGLRRCPHCGRFLPIAQPDCPYCGAVSKPEA